MDSALPDRTDEHRSGEAAKFLQCRPSNRELDDARNVSMLLTLIRGAANLLKQTRPSWAECTRPRQPFSRSANAYQPGLMSVEDLTCPLYGLCKVLPFL